MFEKAIVKKLRGLIKMASELGLREDDMNNAIEALSHNEWGVCYDIVVTQLYEYEIKITDDFFKLAREIEDDMRIDQEKYAFLKTLLN